MEFLVNVEGEAGGDGGALGIGGSTARIYSIDASATSWLRRLNGASAKGDIGLVILALIDVARGIGTLPFWCPRRVEADGRRNKDVTTNVHQAKPEQRTERQITTSLLAYSRA